MRMFRKRGDVQATAVAERPWYGPTRALLTLVGVAVAGFIVWLATQTGDMSTGGYWAQYGIVAGAGLVLALSQLLGGWTKFGIPRLSASVFLIGFIPTLIVVGWIALFHQPHGNWFRGHVARWSGDMNIDGVVRDLSAMLPVLTLGLGLVFGYCFDTTGVRRTATRPEPVDRQATDAPLTAEREVVTGRAADHEPATTPQRTAPEE